MYHQKFLVTAQWAELKAGAWRNCLIQVTITLVTFECRVVIGHCGVPIDGGGWLLCDCGFVCCVAFQIKVENDDQDQDGQGGNDGGSHHGLIVITGVRLAGGQGRGRGGGGQGGELLHVGLDNLAVGEVGLQPDLVP